MAMFWVSRPVSVSDKENDKQYLASTESSSYSDLSMGDVPLAISRQPSLTRRWMLATAIEDDETHGQSNNENMMWLRLENGNVVAAKRSEIVQVHPHDRSIPNNLASLPTHSQPTLVQTLREVFRNGGQRSIFAGETLVYLGLPMGLPRAKPCKTSDPLRKFANTIRQCMLTKQANQVVLTTGACASGKTVASRELIRELTIKSPELRRALHAAGKILRSLTSTLDEYDQPRSRTVLLTELLYHGEKSNTSGPVAAQMNTVFFEPWRVNSPTREGLAIFQLITGGLSSDALSQLGLANVPFVSQRHTLFAYELADLVNHMDTLGFSKRDQDALFITLASILHLTKISFVMSKHEDRVIECCSQQIQHQRRRSLTKARPKSTGSSFLVRRHASSAPSAFALSSSVVASSDTEDIPVRPSRSWSISSLLSSAETDEKIGASQRQSSGRLRRSQRSTPVKSRPTSLDSRITDSTSSSSSRTLGRWLIDADFDIGNSDGQDLKFNFRSNNGQAVSGSPMEKAAILLGVDIEALEETLCSGAVNPDEAESRTQALARSLFLMVISWIEKRVNRALTDFPGYKEYADNNKSFKKIIVVDTLPSCSELQDPQDVISSVSDNTESNFSKKEEEQVEFTDVLANFVSVAIENDIFDHSRQVTVSKDDSGSVNTSKEKDLLFGNITRAGLLSQLAHQHSEFSFLRAGRSESVESEPEAGIYHMDGVEEENKRNPGYKSNMCSSPKLCCHDKMECHIKKAGRSQKFSRLNRLGDFSELWAKCTNKILQQDSCEVSRCPTQVITLYQQRVSRLLADLMNAGNNTHFIRCVRTWASSKPKQDVSEMAYQNVDRVNSVTAFCDDLVLRQVTWAKLDATIAMHKRGCFSNTVSLQSIVRPFKSALPLLDRRRPEHEIVKSIMAALNVDRSQAHVTGEGVHVCIHSISLIQTLRHPTVEQLAALRRQRIRSAWRTKLVCISAVRSFLKLYANCKRRNSAAKLIAHSFREYFQKLFFIRRERAARTIQQAFRRTRACYHPMLLLKRLQVAARVKMAKRAIQVRARETAHFRKQRPSFTLTG